MAIRQFTVYPQRTDSPDNFADNGDSWIRELSTQFIPDANELAVDVNSKSIIATEQAVIATEQAVIATIQAQSAADQVVLAANEVSEASDQVSIAYSIVNFKGSWGTLSGGLTLPASVFWGNRNWQLLETLADVTLYEPGISDKWRVIKEPITRAEAYYLWSM